MAFQKNMRVLIVDDTSTSRMLIRDALEQLGMTHWFASIIGGDTTGVLKPDPAPIHAMIAQAGGGRCVFIGDTINDIAGARNAGVANIAVSFGFIECPPEELEPDAVIDHFDELVPLLRNWPG